MIAIPALDLREGACVQLVGGSYDEERVRLSEPLAVAERWRASGFRQLHVVDLDAALGRGSNSAMVHALAALDGLEVQAGGGVRDDDAIAALFDAGATRVVVGTRALEDPAWLERVSRRWPGRLVVAADVRGTTLVSRGWQQTLERSVLDAVTALHALPLAAVLVTAVHREGRMQGPDLALIQDVAQRSLLPVQSAGGISTAEDLHALAACGVTAAVLGMALYTGALNATAVAKEFAR